MGEFASDSVDETLALGQWLGASLGVGSVVLLIGELGAGKTVFAKGIAAGLGIFDATVRSPSFTLLDVYEGDVRIYHLDLYRVETFEEVEQAGLLDVFDAGAIVVVEWADKISEIHRGMPRVEVVIEVTGPNTRQIRIRRIG